MRGGSLSIRDEGSCGDLFGCSGGPSGEALIHHEGKKPPRDKV